MDECRLPHVRAELLRRRDLDQDARHAFLDLASGAGRAASPVSAGGSVSAGGAAWAPVAAVDSDNLAYLDAQLGEHGWLGSHLVGVDGASACWLLTQHAPLDRQDRWLPLLAAAVRAGRASPTDLAYLRDRVDMRHGRPQRHGTQFYGVGPAGARLWPIADPAALNRRRADVGLPPLATDLVAGAWTEAEVAEHR